MILVHALRDRVADHAVQTLFDGIAEDAGAGFGQILFPDHLSPDGIIDVMMDIGHFVGDPHDLAFQGRRHS